MLNSNDILDIELGKTDQTEAIRLLIEDWKYLSAQSITDYNLNEEIREIIRLAAEAVTSAEHELDCAIDNVVEATQPTIKEACDIFKATSDWLHQTYIQLKKGE